MNYDLRGIRFFTFFLVFLACNSPVHSQSDYREGFIVSNRLDTIPGLIQYNEKKKAANVCNFKANPDALKVTYSPDQIVAYGYKDDRQYESKTVFLDQDSSRLFLELLVGGKAKLFSYDRSLWLEREGSNLEALTNDPIERKLNGTTFVQKSNQYIVSLNMALNDCESLRGDIQATTFTERSLINIVDAYNKCINGESVIFKDRRPKFKFSVGISAGTQYSQINFNTSLQHLKGRYEKSLSPIGGLTFDFYSPRLSEKISITGSLLYTASNYYLYSKEQGTGFVTNNSVSINLKELKLPIGISYQFSAKQSTPFITIGSVYSLHLKAKSNWISEKVEPIFNPIRITTNSEEPFLVRPHQWGVYGGFGWNLPVYKKFYASLEFRTELTNGVIDKGYDLPGEDHLYSNITNFQFILSLKTK
ncbi:MAG: outer membrane beta-barrel protein [Cyclobacteriaceae bacterium]|nr:MAG: outer membrane beta-barrel protein [Cyclobacteriaceae bacterium]